MRIDASEQRLERVALERDLTRSGAEDVGFQLFEFGIGEALGVHEALPPLEMRRNAIGVRARHFVVVAERLRVLDLQRLDAALRSRALLEGEDEFSAARAQRHRFAQAGVMVRPDDAAVGDRRRHVVDERRAQSPRASSAAAPPTAMP